MRSRRLLFAAASLTLLVPVSCAPEYRPWWLGGTAGIVITDGGVFGTDVGRAFTGVLLDERTFVNGQSVTTVTYRAEDMDRIRIGVDFNRDGKVDPVVTYGTTWGVVQILLSVGAAGVVDYVSLTLDGGDNLWTDIRDAAVGDIDGDGNLDLVLATQDGVVYLRHPSNPGHTHVLREWGQESGELELIEGTQDTLTVEEQTALILQALGPGANLDHYIITVEQGYNDVEIGDVDNDGHNDIVASRRLRINLDPAPDAPVDSLTLVAGSLQVLFNPGGAQNGIGWTTTIVSKHERHAVFDREGASGVWLADLDDDGDLDIVNAASDDVNVQVAWFENPGGPGAVDPTSAWEQHRIGSLRGAAAVDVADLTGDGRLDVIACSRAQRQVMLFVQPSTGPSRSYDWFSAPIITFDGLEPIDLRALDVDRDGVLEIVATCTEGAVRYFEPTPVPVNPWTPVIVTSFASGGEVGLMGYGDVDGDGDLDLVTVVDAPDDLSDSVYWVRNNTIP